jgi:peptidyl-tRNA hydrolase, PTH1 family
VAWLIAGLGNPGDRYARSRHNVGRMVVDELVRQAGERFGKARFLPAEVAEIREGDERLVLVRSPLFMNESGPAYAGVARKRGIEPERIIAVHDELEIPAGAIRLKFGGGTAGHNGLKSLQASLRTADFFRARVGVGRPPGRQDPADFVLAPIGARDVADLAIVVDRTADAVRVLVREGLEAAQNRFHARESPD